MKRCPKCQDTKPYCSAPCRQRDWTRNNRERHNAAVCRYRARRYQAEGQWRDEGPKARAMKAWMLEIKSKPCQDCNNKFPACCMDFDHVRGKKLYNIGSMFAHHYSRELIETELAKCDLTCSNCHRIRTQKRRTGSGKYSTNDI